MSGSLGRRDPQPMTRDWEAPVLVLVGVAIALGLAALIGLGVAAWVFGGGWVWPEGSDTVGQVLGGLLSGQPGAGLAPELRARVPGPAAVYSCIAIAELIAVTLSITAAVLFCRNRRPNDARRGMATRAEATTVLGRARLREARTIIRPDLYGTASKADR